MEPLKKRLEELARGGSPTSAQDPFGVFRLSEEEMKLCSEQASLVKELVRSSHRDAQHHDKVVLPPSIVLPLLC